jgi:mRNA-degrading endonuclease RelE of RelBE toxin-antitoxin system
MNLPLEVILSKLDAPTRKRIVEKLQSVAADPLDSRNSYPLQGTDKRSARVGGYRILLLICDPVLLITDIESRGQVYSRI